MSSSAQTGISTSPTLGLPHTFNDRGKELPFQGVYRLTANGRLDLLTRELAAPNGIAFSPDERTLYVSNADRRNTVWVAFPLNLDGTLGPSRVLYDGTRTMAGLPGSADGMKVDVHGNIFAAGPGGVYVFDSAGSLLGWFDLAGKVGNVAWGESGSTLFIAANAAIYRVRLSTGGAGLN